MASSILATAAMPGSTTTPESPIAEEDPQIFVSLTHDPLSITALVDRVRSPKAGAIVLFAGTTRDSFDSRPVSKLSYTSYAPLALKTLRSIASQTKSEHNLTAIAIAHRLGDVPIGEESVLIVVSAPHRAAAWRAGEQALELVKAKVEIWKWEEFGDENGSGERADGDGGSDLAGSADGAEPRREGQWKANREWKADGAGVGTAVDGASTNST